MWLACEAQAFQYSWGAQMQNLVFGGLGVYEAQTNGNARSGPRQVLETCEPVGYQTVLSRTGKGSLLEGITFY